MKPKMILFDAGRTLIDYASIDTRKGITALMSRLVSNPRKLTVEDIHRETNRVSDLFEASRKQLYEVPEQTILHLVHDLLGLTFSIPLTEVERTIWNEDAEIVPMPNAEKLLGFLNEMRIRTGVVSNLDFSGYLLRERLDELYPDNRFEFVIASSEYGVRKPHPFIFEAAISRSGLDASEIWYVGDKIHVDVAGSRNVGMTPVLYKSPRNHYSEIPDDLIAIDDFLDLLKYIENA